jgi:hypothetical protein
MISQKRITFIVPYALSASKPKALYNFANGTQNKDEDGIEAQV